MRNFIQSHDTITVPAPAAISSGQAVLVGDLFGVAQGDAASGAPVPIVTCGVFRLPKLAAQLWAVGAKVYWDDGNARTTTVASGNKLIGVATVAAANPSETGDVRLDGAVR